MNFSLKEKLNNEGYVWSANQRAGQARLVKLGWSSYVWQRRVFIDKYPAFNIKEIILWFLFSCILKYLCVYNRWGSTKSSFYWRKNRIVRIDLICIIIYRYYYFAFCCWSIFLCCLIFTFFSPHDMFDFMNNFLGMSELLTCLCCYCMNLI